MVESGTSTYPKNPVSYDFGFWIYPVFFLLGLFPATFLFFTTGMREGFGVAYALVPYNILVSCFFTFIISFFRIQLFEMVAKDCAMAQGNF